MARDSRFAEAIASLDPTARAFLETKRENQRRRQRAPAYCAAARTSIRARNPPRRVPVSEEI